MARILGPYAWGEEGSSVVWFTRFNKTASAEKRIKPFSFDQHIEIGDASANVLYLGLCERP